MEAYLGSPGQREINFIFKNYCSKIEPHGENCQFVINNKPCSSMFVLKNTPATISVHVTDETKEFDKWHDDNTENPRTFYATSVDISPSAYIKQKQVESLVRVTLADNNVKMLKSITTLSGALDSTPGSSSVQLGVQYCTDGTQINNNEIVAIECDADCKCVSLGDKAFSNCSMLTSINMPSLTSLDGSYNLYRASNLKNVNLENVKRCGYWAMSKCTALETINMPQISSLGQYTFQDNTGMKYVMCSNLLTVDQGAFNGCTSLISVDLPSVNTISSDAFYKNMNITNINISSVQFIGDRGFGGYNTPNGNFTELNVPSLTSVGNSAFYKHTKLTSIIAPSLKIISGNAFDTCSSLVSICLDSVTSIGTAAFSSCSSLTSVDLPNVTSLDSGNYASTAFKNCSNIKSVRIPKLQSATSQLFGSCSKLNDMYLDEVTTVPTIPSYGFLPTSSVKKVTVHVPSDLVDAFKAASTWKFHNIVAI